MNKAIILAAGIGSRLFPYTKDMPKCLLTVGNMNILEYQINALKKNTIRDIIIVVGHKGEKIEEFINSNKKFDDLTIKFIKNDNYKTTNSSYSLWLARNEIKNGFIYLNSDLIFDPDLLKKILDSNYEDCIIINKKINPTSDMFKVKMKQNKIFHMNKEMEEEEIAGEAVGPAKFSQEGTTKIITRLEKLVKDGDYSNWCYRIFSDVSKEHDFYGIDSDGLFWTEIDNPSDLKNARIRIKEASLFKS
ncbi:hypothetical protein CMO94_01280 [Candidatus Woesearchaeota archaeon]|jgi:choline kinase|nr:hypothetical protein [Candidatus Woesearchaeota archaeon]|tara:strand:- start:59 stop:799 length:741 start_codon:yes stop_codon:yes gene_type:complete